MAIEKGLGIRKGVAAEKEGKTTFFFRYFPFHVLQTKETQTPHPN